MTRRPNASRVSRAGVNYLRTLVERENCIFHEIHGENDVGIDALVEFVENEKATGFLVAVQIKSGRSFKSANGYSFPTDEQHLSYWANYIMPVAAVVYDTDKEVAFWTDLRHQAKKTPNTTRVRVSSDTPLTKSSFRRFRDYFLTYRDAFSSDATFGATAERLLLASSRSEALVAIRGLFAFHRERVATWTLICRSIRMLAAMTSCDLAVAALRYITGHGDVSWNDHNTISEKTRELAQRELLKNVGAAEIVSLLACVDEDNLTRGGLGQDVLSIISIVDNGETLAHIALNKQETDNIRYFAMIFSIAFLQDKEGGDKMVRNLIRDVCRTRPSDSLVSRVLMIRDHIEEHEFLHLL